MSVQNLEGKVSERVSSVDSLTSQDVLGHWSKRLQFADVTAKTTAAVFFLSVAFFAFSNAAKYSGRLDNIDLDEVLRSDRLLKNYFECLMERGPCTAEGADLKKAIPDALQTDCTKCSQSQKKKAAKAIDFLRDNKQSMYDELVKKYDPEGKYKERIEKNLNLKTKSRK